MTPVERIAAKLAEDAKLRLAVAELILDEMGDNEALYELGEEICVATFGPRVPCPQCGESSGAEIFPGRDCYECGGDPTSA